MSEEILHLGGHHHGKKLPSHKFLQVIEHVDGPRTFYRRVYARLPDGTKLEVMVHTAEQDPSVKMDCSLADAYFLGFVDGKKEQLPAHALPGLVPVDLYPTPEQIAKLREKEKS